LPPVHELEEDAPPITEDDINRGMMELVNKGIIPKDVDLTPAFEKGSAPVSVRGMKFFEKQKKHVRGEIMMDAGPKSNIKYDLQPAPPVLRTTV
jgi:hypothetical protein